MLALGGPNLSKRKTTKVKHRVRVPYKDCPALMGQLIELGDNRLALFVRLCMLTACRPGELVKAEWSQFDVEARVWTKTARDHQARS